MLIKKTISIFIMLFIVTASFLSCFSTVSSKSYVETQCSPKKWTWIFYNDADFEQAYDPMDDFALEAYSAENLDVIVLQDTYGDPAKLWYIDEDHNKELLEELGEVNMGDYETLRDLVSYCKQNFPSDRYLLSVYNHGGGWAGACTDNTDDDHLIMDEFQRALEETGGVDIICFTAPCLMGAVESAYELRDCVDVYIGSEELSGYFFWLDVIDDMCGLLNEKIYLSNVEIGKKIIELVDENLDSRDVKRDGKYWEHVTMSAIDTNGMDNISKYVDKIAKDLVYKVKLKPFSRFRIKIIHYFSESFGSRPYIKIFGKLHYFKRNIRISSYCLDLYDFAEKCSIFFAFDRRICLNSKDLMDSIDGAVIANINCNLNPRAYGMSIYFPSRLRYSSMYNNNTLDFINDTYWDEFLRLFFFI